MPFASCTGYKLYSMNRPSQRSSWVRTLPSMTTGIVVAALLGLAALNMVQRASWSEMEDGVLWKVSGAEVAAAEIAKGTAAERAGLQRGDVLLAIGDREIQRIEDVVDVLHTSRPGATLHYLIMREKARQQATIDVAPVPSSPLALYFALAAVGVFSLLVGASVRLRRPDHQATLHFFWLTVAFFGGVSVAGVINGGTHGEVLTRVAAYVQYAQLLYLAISLVAGFVIMVRALRVVRSVTARRQLRWIVWGTALGSVPFVFGYALPFGFGLEPLRGFEFSALLLGLIPLAFASAIVRYRLIDVEVIINPALPYSAALAAIAAIYAIRLQPGGAIFRPRADRNPVIALLP